MYVAGILNMIRIIIAKIAWEIKCTENYNIQKDVTYAYTYSLDKIWIYKYLLKEGNPVEHINLICPLCYQGQNLCIIWLHIYKEMWVVKLEADSVSH